MSNNNAEVNANLNTNINNTNTNANANTNANINATTNSNNLSVELKSMFNYPLRQARDMFEKLYFEYHLKRENNNIIRLAEKTELERTHLYRKLKQLGINLKANSNNMTDEEYASLARSRINENTLTMEHLKYGRDEDTTISGIINNRLEVLYSPSLMGKDINELLDCFKKIITNAAQ